MSDPLHPRHELQSAYFVQDRSNQEEMTRLQVQDHLLTALMGGVLPEQSDPSRFERMLDVGCGAGSWLIETAQAYPGIRTLIGVDSNLRMVEYAREQARLHQVGDRVEFHVMDALRMLEFPNAFFDLVNHRLGMGWVRQWEWPKLLSEYQRVSRRAGIIRLTESEFFVESSSPALLRLNQLCLHVLYQAGNVFTLQPDGLTSQLAPLLQQYAGIRDVQTHAHTVPYRAGTPEWQSFYEDVRLIFRTLVPFFRRWTKVPDDYEEIYQQMLTEMQQPDFVATWHLLTAWGSRKGRFIKLSQ
ncbi:MAG TPA: class I SAM-dependent methyltransferase [Ktedonosporobacter sp.]|nr:class I SAM-dependent methyltransferase [Ktedonosporobacter sp.]